MGAAHHSVAPFGLQSRKQALLIIHGIGEQNPYETLDSFARGVFTYLRDALHVHAKAKLCPIEIAHKDWTQVGMRIGLFDKDRELPECPESSAHAAKHGEDEPDARVDLFEYYWAPLTEDKLTAVETVKWVLFTDLTPLKYFVDDLQEMIGAQHMGRLRATGKALKLYARELARVLLLYVPLAAGLGLLLHWLSGTHSWTEALKNIFAHSLAYLTVVHGAILLLYFLTALMGWFGLQGLWELKQYPGAAIETIGDVVWLVLDALGAAVFLAVALELDLRPGRYVAWHVLRRVFGNGHWQPLAGAALAWIVGYAMTAYVADVAVYTNMDAKSKNFVTRNAILDGSTAALKMLLACGEYDRVILAGHSLGSVIAYDTINEILAQYNANPSPQQDDRPELALTLAQLESLKGLVTFGCPLDKIYYFFREHVKRNQAIRAQILSMLHSFRKKRSGRDYGKFEFNYHFGQLDELVWLNAWARMDFVSGRLQFYRVNNQRQFCYATPVLAHLSYWSDPNFYEYFCGKLL